MTSAVSTSIHRFTAGRSSFFAAFAGAGVRGGQVIGRSDKTGGYPLTTPFTPDDLGATVYHVLGIDPRQTFNDHTGRPIPILDDGRAIAEVI